MPRSPQKNPEVVLTLGLSEEESRFVTCNVTEYDLDGKTIRIEQFKTLSYKNGKPVGYGPDDETYLKFPNLIRKVPRAFSRLYILGVKFFEMRGLEKFDGITSYDEDECDQLPASSHGFIDENVIQRWYDVENLKVSFEEKANGKMAVFTILEDDGEWYIYGGSKNYHRLYNLDVTDISISSNINGDDLCSRILKCIIAELNKLSVHDVMDMKGRTFVGEYVDGEHLVYTHEPYMSFFNLGVFDPLPNVKHLLPSQTYPPSADEIKSIRQLDNTEGCVVIYENIETGEIYRHKLKTIWYTILRSWREVIKGCVSSSFGIDEMIKRCIHRTHIRSEQFLHLDEDELHRYIKLCYDFLWYINDNDDFANVSSGIGRLYHDFVKAGGLENLGLNYAKVSDVIVEKKDVEPEDILTDVNLLDSSLEAVRRGHKIAFILQGAPGSGKSTISSYIRSHVEDCSIHSTDSYFIKDGIYTFNPRMIGKYHSLNLEAFTASQSQVKICDNTNTTQKEWCKYAKNARSQGYIVIFLSCKEMNPTVLASRTLHRVPIEAIGRMVSRMNRPYPQYIGLFVKKESLPIEGKQKTPYHITLKYIGCKKMDHDLNYNPENFMIVGLSKNKAGDALVVELNPGLETKNVPHITLTTNEGFSPVDVGKNINLDELERLKIDVEGFILPTW